MGVGFMYLFNHGISNELIDRVFADTKAFHEQDLSFKIQYSYADPADNSG